VWLSSVRVKRRARSSRFVVVVAFTCPDTADVFDQTRATVPLQRTDGDGSNLYKSAEEVRDPGLETLEKWRALIGGALVSTERVLIGEGTSKVWLPSSRFLSARAYAWA
jgi:hypothetical protein